MSSTTWSQAFLLDQEYQQDQLGMLGFPLNLSFNFNMIPPFSNYPQYSLKALSGLASASSLAASEAASPSSPITTSHQLLSLNTSTINPWEWGEECGRRKREEENEGEKNAGASAMKMKRTLMKRRRKVREPRFCFKTMSDVDVLDDGYKWRKYGQKVVKNTHHPRSYYRCTQDNCRVKKRVERLAEDPRMVITTYEGRHVHSPSSDLQDPHTHPSQLSTFFW